MGGFLSSIKSAFSFIVSAVEKGVSATETALGFASVGAELPIAEIAAEMTEIEAAKEGWAKISQMEWFARIPEKFGLKTDFDYAGEHIMKMLVHGRTLMTGIETATWVTIESPTALTKWEWTQLAKTASTGWFTTEPMTLDYIEEYEYYVKE